MVSNSADVDAEVAMPTGEVALRTVGALPVASTSETALVESCRQGDAEAFARLVGLHQGMVYNLAVRLLGDGEEARDLSQEVFLQVHRTLGRFEGRSSLKTWIFRIVVNLGRNRQRWWRRRFRHRSCGIDDISPREEARVSANSASSSSPYELARRRERALKVQAALLRLSFDHRAILLLKEVEELSCDQIAAALGIPEGTVKSRLARARDSLRRVLAPSLEEGVES
jgi:RNA polymerase sigma-70 factor (ECF subfamily)